MQAGGESRETTCTEVWGCLMQDPARDVGSLMPPRWAVGHVGQPV